MSEAYDETQNSETWTKKIEIDVMQIPVVFVSTMSRKHTLDIAGHIPKCETSSLIP